MTHSLLPCGPEIVRRQLREDSEVDHFVELTKNEVRGAGLPSMKELVNFTYVGDELHSLRAIDDEFGVGACGGFEAQNTIIKRLLETVTEYGVAHVLTSEGSGYHDLMV